MAARFLAAPGKTLQFIGTTLDEVKKDIQALAEESVEYVYGSVIRKFNGNEMIASSRYDVKITVQLVRK